MTLIHIYNHEEVLELDEKRYEVEQDSWTNLHILCAHGSNKSQFMLNRLSNSDITEASYFILNYV